jgi:hypothetical protein
MESSNNIIHPTRPKGLAFGSSCFERVMMSDGQSAWNQNSTLDWRHPVNTGFYDQSLGIRII